MRPPPDALVVDAAILVSAALGRSGPVLFDVARKATLVTTDRAAREAARRIELGLQRPDLLPILNAILAAISVVAAARLAPAIGSAEDTLRDAVHSRNGSVADAHVLALAWQANADIWSHDRDFAGAGVASWSTINLIAALADA